MKNNDKNDIIPILDFDYSKYSDLNKQSENNVEQNNDAEINKELKNVLEKTTDENTKEPDINTLVKTIKESNKTNKRLSNAVLALIIANAVLIAAVVLTAIFLK